MKVIKAQTLKKLIPSERQEQIWLVDWMSYQSSLKDFFCKNDNEGKRTPLQGYMLKRMGLRKGVSDIFIYRPTNSHHGLWLEMKRNKKYSRSERLNPTWIAQESFQETVRGVGYAAYFCYGWADGKSIIENYLSN